jgi:hypothetical protein
VWIFTTLYTSTGAHIEQPSELIRTHESPYSSCPNSPFRLPVSSPSMREGFCHLSEEGSGSGRSGVSSRQTEGSLEADEGGIFLLGLSHLWRMMMLSVSSESNKIARTASKKEINKQSFTTPIKKRGEGSVDIATGMSSMTKKIDTETSAQKLKHIHPAMNNHHEQAASISPLSSHKLGAIAQTSQQHKGDRGDRGGGPRALCEALYLLPLDFSLDWHDLCVEVYALIRAIRAYLTEQQTSWSKRKRACCLMKPS